MMPGEAEILVLLDREGLKWKDSGNYLVIQCPLHNDTHPSAQLFRDSWVVNCFAGCGSFPLTKAFPELNRERGGQPSTRVERKNQPVIYKNYDLFSEWQAMPLIPRNHRFKGIPLEVLDELGWRWTSGIAGMGAGYFIPYFDKERRSIRFAQVRHLNSERRFTFLPQAKPTIYGAWNLVPVLSDKIENRIIFIVEGTSDGVVMEYAAMVPWVAMPSASSGAIMAEFALWCKKNKIRIIYAGDNDDPGDALKRILDEKKCLYRACQPPADYKDWGDFFEAEGQAAVFEKCMRELFS